MVDKERRRRLAYQLRHLSIGLITNDEFEDNVMDEVTNGWLPEQYYKSKDATLDDLIIRPMLELSWCLYNDTEEHSLTGRHKLNKQQLKDIARYILFLLSDFEYEWQYIDPINPLIRLSFKEVLLSALTLGQYYRNKKTDRLNDFIEMKSLGDYEYWPFFKKQDYEQQLTRPPFFQGQPKANA